MNIDNTLLFAIRVLRHPESSHSHPHPEDASLHSTVSSFAVGGVRASSHKADILRHLQERLPSTPRTLAPTQATTMDGQTCALFSVWLSVHFQCHVPQQGSPQALVCVSCRLENK